MKRTAGGESEKALALMFELGRIIRRAMIGGGEGCLPLAATEALRFVGERGAPTMREIAGYLRVSGPSATGLVEELASEGYLIRRTDLEDRRLVRIALSAKGAALLKRTTRIRASALRRIMGSLSAKDRRELIRLLSIMVQE